MTYDLCISSFFPLLVSHTYFFKELLPLPIFVKISFSPSKKGIRGGRELSKYSSKNLYNNIWLSLCVVFGAFWFFFKYFYSCLPCLIWLFAKNLNFYFHEQIKQKTGNKFHSPIKWEIKNPYGNISNQVNLKDSSVFQRSKFWGGLQ